eukprot:2848142-Amphidinium_carterae.2
MHVGFPPALVISACLSIGVVLCQTCLTGKNPFYEIGIDDEKRVREKISSPAAADFPAQLWADVTQ